VTQLSQLIAGGLGQLSAKEGISDEFNWVSIHAKESNYARAKRRMIFYIKTTKGSIRDLLVALFIMISLFYNFQFKFAERQGFLSSAFFK